MSPIIPFLIGFFGAYYTIEGAANIIYWWNDHHPWYFQVGRVLRTAFGLSLIIIAAILARLL